MNADGIARREEAAKQITRALEQADNGNEAARNTLIATSLAEFLVGQQEARDVIHDLTEAVKAFTAELKRTNDKPGDFTKG
jgi:phosphoglycerol transferase MdoB-like AlkP superfamily enzyme